MFLEIIIAMTTINILGCAGKKNQKKIINQQQQPQKIINHEIKKDINWLYSADLGKLVESYTVKKSGKGKIQYIHSPYLKDTKNGNHFYTITTQSGTRENNEEPKMIVFSDKPQRSTYEQILSEGLLTIFKNDKHRNTTIKDEHPNGVINLYKKNCEIVSFPVTFTGCTPHSPNMLIKYLTGDHKKNPFTKGELSHYNSLDNESRKKMSDFIWNARENVKKNCTIENQIPDSGQKEQLKKKYGNRFMDNILRHCKITFKFLNEKDRLAFEYLMNKNFDNISNVNTFIDSYPTCVSLKSFICITAHITVMAAAVAFMGEEEAAVIELRAAVVEGGKVLEGRVNEYIDAHFKSKGVDKLVVDTIVSCLIDALGEIATSGEVSSKVLLCLINPIIDFIQQCECSLFYVNAKRCTGTASEKYILADAYPNIPDAKKACVKGCAHDCHWQPDLLDIAGGLGYFNCVVRGTDKIVGTYTYYECPMN